MSDLVVSVTGGLSLAAYDLRYVRAGGVYVNDQRLKEWVSAEAFEIVAATYGVDGVLDSAIVKWPDGSAGVLTVTATNLSFMTVDAFTATHTLSGKTVTQPTVTRDAGGRVTVKPALTVAV
jgi:hypothetical protein